MTQKPRRKLSVKWDDPAESERFLDEAKAAEASDDPKDLGRAVRAVAPRRDGKERAAST